MICGATQPEWPDVEPRHGRYPCCIYHQHAVAQGSRHGCTPGEAAAATAWIKRHGDIAEPPEPGAVTILSHLSLRSPISPGWRCCSTGDDGLMGATIRLVAPSPHAGRLGVQHTRPASLERANKLG